jgi:hypothetical protein
VIPEDTGKLLDHIFISAQTQVEKAKAWRGMATEIWNEIFILPIMETIFREGITDLPSADRNSLRKSQHTKEALWRFLSIFRSEQEARMHLISDIVGASREDLIVRTAEAVDTIVQAHMSIYKEVKQQEQLNWAHAARREYQRCKKQIRRLREEQARGEAEFA